MRRTASFVALSWLLAAAVGCEAGTIPPDAGAPPLAEAGADTPDTGGPPCKSIGDSCLTNTECCTSICTTKSLFSDATTPEPSRCAATP